ncbi:MAG: glycosyltransferase [Calditrichaeota bacterium]|nr:MAG: glycosyltransferase [Calditrichota bacterium]
MGSVKKVGIVHYRAGRTDGVSLEMEKRKTILQSLGVEVRMISGPVQRGSDFVIEELEFDAPEIREIKENAFGYFGNHHLSSARLMEKIHMVAQKIETAFREYHRREQFDALLVHNIFSHGRHIAAASAFARFARNTGLPIVSTNHDYYWEREEYQEPTSKSVQEYLDLYVPPAYPNIVHVSINSIAREGLLRRRGIDSVVLPDVFDFHQPPWVRDAFNADFPEMAGFSEQDLVILQATRIVPRKGIELAMELVAELNRHKSALEGKTLYNGKRITSDSRVVLVLAGYAEDSAREYRQWLEEIARHLGIEARFIAPRIGAKRSSNGDKRYSLWDAYVYADLVTYPSLYEGWGNQFIEAVFARKPIVVFEYPVFKADIQPEGYHYISLGDRVIREQSGRVKLPTSALQAAAEQTMKTLLSPETPRHLEENFAIGARYHDYAVMREFLQKHLCS